jgi:dihydrofolate reductase
MLGMTKVQYFTACTLDGYIADENNSLDGVNLWLGGGGDLVGQFHDAGLLDEIILGMTPVTLGGGAPLLPRRITSKQLAFEEAELIGQRIRIVLSVRR